MFRYSFNSVEAARQVVDFTQRLPENRVKSSPEILAALRELVAMRYDEYAVARAILERVRLWRIGGHPSR